MSQAYALALMASSCSCSSAISFDASANSLILPLRWSSMDALIFFMISFSNLAAGSFLNMENIGIPLV